MIPLSLDKIATAIPATNNTVFLATVIGWYLVIFSLFLLFRYSHFKLLITDFVTQQGLFFMVAVITLILGLLMVTSHNIWVKGFPVVITLFSWLVLISALIRLFFPNIVMGQVKLFLNHPIRIKIIAVILFLLGLMFLFHVYYTHNYMERFC